MKLSYKETQRRQDLAESFVREVKHDDERAGEIADMTTQEYADSRGIEILNPPGREVDKMAVVTKAELQRENEELTEVLEGIYEKVSDVLGYEEEEEEEEEEEDE